MSLVGHAIVKGYLRGSEVVDTRESHPHQHSRHVLAQHSAINFPLDHFVVAMQKQSYKRYKISEQSIKGIDAKYHSQVYTHRDEF